MTTLSVRKKVHQYVDDADENILEVVYKMLQIYLEDEEITSEQKIHINQRLKKYERGGNRLYTWEEVKRNVQKRKK